MTATVERIKFDVEKVVEVAVDSGREVLAWVSSGNGHGFVLCRMGTGDKNTEFATWATDRDGHTYWGHYFPARAYEGDGWFTKIGKAYDEAMADFHKRAFGEGV